MLLAWLRRMPCCLAEAHPLQNSLTRNIDRRSTEPACPQAPGRNLMVDEINTRPKQISQFARSISRLMQKFFCMLAPQIVHCMVPSRKSEDAKVNCARCSRPYV